jgi:carboxyl-terminal processing protease
LRSNRAFLLLGALLVLAGSLLGGTLGSRAAGSGAAEDRMDEYVRLLMLVEDHYVEPVEPRDLIYDSIRGMVRALDPHSNFLDDEQYADMREEQRGEFYGLGIVISKRGKNQPLTVISPIDGTPASRLGVRAGDVITHVRDERTGTDTDTLGLSVQEAVNLLRGPRGTPVEVTIDRLGLDEPLVFEIIRDVVPTRAVVNSYMIRPGTGYIRLVNFTQTTTRELDEALDDLERQQMRRLLLDLRDNPGGLLDQAVKVADRFVGGGQVIVSTRGRVPGSDQEFFATDRVTRPDYPVIVLVNGGSASASEIVAGAVQDHDRGLVVGETTFGKGLVQSVYPLGQNTALALTTQKYYTPSGRLIQRDYSNLEEYMFERGDETALPEDEDREERLTDGGRTVFGGGGIAPDVEVSLEERPSAVDELLRANAFFRYTVLFESERGDAPPDPEAETDEALVHSFQAWIEGEELDHLDPVEVAEASEWIVAFIRAEIAAKREGLAARDRVLAERDAQIRRALESFDEARSLAELRPGAVAPAPASLSGGQARAQSD